MATLADISKETGLAIATVAHILKNRPGYSESTRQRVLQIAQRLNYRPNIMGRALVSGRTMSIGLITTPLGIPNQVIIIQELESIARQQGYSTYITVWGGESHDRCAEELLARRVDGLIIYGTMPFPKPILGAVRQQGTPVVYLDWAPAGTRSHVSMNRRIAFRAVAEHLTQFGHRRVVYLCSEYDVHYPKTRLDPYRRFFKSLGVALEVIPELGYRNEGERAFQLAVRRLKHDRPPTAIVTMNDDAALGVLSAALSLGLNVPRDLSVVGFNDLPFARACWPPLTTIHQPREALPRAAFEMLQRLMKDCDATIDPVSIDCSLIVRGSTGPAPQ